MLVEMRLL